MMAQNVDLARAKAAILYKPPAIRPTSDTSLEELNNSASKSVAVKSSTGFDETDAISVIEDILRAQETLSQLKSKSGKQKLQEEWANPLGATLVESLNRLVFLIMTLYNYLFSVDSMDLF